MEDPETLAGLGPKEAFAIEAALRRMEIAEMRALIANPGSRREDRRFARRRLHEALGEVLIVMKLDPDGMPRAWASGKAEDLDAVRERADRELAAYRIEKDAVGDPLGKAEFTTQTRFVRMKA